MPSKDFAVTLYSEFDHDTGDSKLDRLRQVPSLRALLAEGYPLDEIAQQLDLTQAEISDQISPEQTGLLRPSVLITAGGAVLKYVAEQRGFTNLAVFGSAARGDDQPDSDIDFLVQPPEGANLSDFTQLEETFATILGRKVDLISYRGLDPNLDRDILNDKRLL